jgi:hypothetical protein
LQKDPPAETSLFTKIFPRLTLGENLDAVLGDSARIKIQSKDCREPGRHSQQGLFKLGTEFAVRSRRGPVVRPVNLAPVAAQVDHLQVRGAYLDQIPEADGVTQKAKPHRLNGKALESYDQTSRRACQLLLNAHHSRLHCSDLGVGSEIRVGQIWYVERPTALFLA